ESPNCVSSYARDVVHRIDPFTYEGSGEEALAEIQSLIENTDSAKVVYSSDDYLYAEYTSNILGFVDDVEFYLDKEAEAIQVRSASRLGQSDLGVNRQRIETIRSQYEDF
ncbi:MAG: DUF1499 domain-containing protein, partial [Coleofasciculaceae cyanobacterium SM2_3_26]|nr:DUF1499 domain-containing protein [Coleofasciculaceae cyanobacterium SM2_3_26]